MKFNGSLKIKFPELYEKIDGKTDNDAIDILLGKFVPVTKLNVGTVPLDLVSEV